MRGNSFRLRASLLLFVEFAGIVQNGFHEEEETPLASRAQANGSYARSHRGNSVGAREQRILSGYSERQMGLDYGRGDAEVSGRSRLGRHRETRCVELAETWARFRNRRRVSAKTSEAGVTERNANGHASSYGKATGAEVLGCAGCWFLDGFHDSNRCYAHFGECQTGDASPTAVAFKVRSSRPRCTCLCHSSLLICRQLCYFVDGIGSRLLL